MMLLGVDVGTTHVKAGVFARDGRAVRVATRPNVSARADDGHFYYAPESLWQSVAAVIADACADHTHEVAAVGIASMAETGLLIERATGAPRSAFLPWFDTSAQSEAEQIERQSDPFERFRRSGIGASFKCSLAKLLWQLARGVELTRELRWLSAADYAAYRLTGAMATDYSLACRTCAFDLAARQWDDAWLAQFALPADIFPEVGPSARVIGHVRDEMLGLRAGTPVSIAGHDHVCAALAVGAFEPSIVFDSMGTAESLLGALPARALTQREYESGFMFGCHVVDGAMYWMGGLSASGGSLEWLRAQLGDPPLAYDDLQQLLAQTDTQPSAIFYFPYLAGSGAPHRDAHARAAFIGLSARHGRADLLKAVLEGTAYELELMRQTAERALDTPLTRLVVAGGGTRNPRWLQIKADVSGCRLDVCALSEATTLGAAMIAGIASGTFADAREAHRAMGAATSQTFVPDAARHAVYRRLFNEGYLPLQAPLRTHYALRLDARVD